MKIDWVLLKRSVLSDISEEERNLLNAWLDESSEHREFYREIKTFCVLRKVSGLRKNEFVGSKLPTKSG